MNEWTYQKHLFGTDVTISLVLPTQTEAVRLATELFTILTGYEVRFSRFRPESELSRLNHAKKLSVSHTFIQILDRAISLSTQTDGAYNPLVQVATLGYQQSFEPDTDPQPITQTPYSTDLSEITIDHRTNLVTLGPTQQLDFGGFLKGHLAHQLIHTVQTTHPECAGAIINIGGDLATFGHDVFHHPFIFLIYNPIAGTDISVPLANTCLATSGTYTRQWHTATGPQHHILDSRTQQNPETDLVSVSIVHPDGGTAEALTKVFFTRRYETAQAVATRSNATYVLITHTGEIINTITQP